MTVIATNEVISGENRIQIPTKPTTYSRRVAILAVGRPPTQFRASLAGFSCD